MSNNSNDNNNNNNNNNNNDNNNNNHNSKNNNNNNNDLINLNKTNSDNNNDDDDNNKLTLPSTDFRWNEVQLHDMYMKGADSQRAAVTRKFDSLGSKKRACAFCKREYRKQVEYGRQW